MQGSKNSVLRRVKRLENELTLWRVLALAMTLMFTLAFAQENQQKEIRLASEDGRQVVVLSPEGITFSDHGKKLGEIGFETIGDGSQQELDIKLSGQISANRAFLQDGKKRLALSAENVMFSENYVPGSTFTPEALMLQDHSGKSKIWLATPSQGIGGLDFIEDRKLILGLGPFGKFRIDNPPRRDAGGIQIGDFGPSPKTRMITAGPELPAGH